MTGHRPTVDPAVDRRAVFLAALEYGVSPLVSVSEDADTRALEHEAAAP